MNEKIKLSTEQYREGLITSREYLGKLIEALGTKWHPMDEDANDDEVNTLADILANL